MENILKIIEIILYVVGIGALVGGLIWRIVKITLWTKSNKSVLINLKRNGEKFYVYEWLFEGWYDFKNGNKGWMVFTVVWECLLYVGAVAFGIYFASDFFPTYYPQVALVWRYVISLAAVHYLLFLILWKSIVCFYYTLFMPIHLMTSNL
ncbi:MAG: hypothetical protein E7362_01105 [Clostridiales bacterium]|nr:hypothetical protein [Clostridiales bacterium]